MSLTPFSVLLVRVSLFCDSSARTTTAIFAPSILYLAAVRGRLESFASDCLGL